MIKQIGSVLIESLIAMLLLTIGVLGIVGFETNLLNQSGTAASRLQATLFAEELIALVNADSLNAGCYVLPISSQVGCANPTATTYLTNWLSEVTTTLPGAAALQPTATLVGGTDYTITLYWKRPSEAISHNYSIATQVPQ